MWVLFLCGVLICLFYVRLRKCNKFWEERGVPYATPFLFFGNLATSLFRFRPVVHVVTDLYNKYPDERYVGVYQFTQPTLMLRDPELIKQIGVKDFHAFCNHKAFGTGEADPIFSKNIFSLTGETGWYEMRAMLSPVYTSSKMRMMFGLIQQIAQQFVEYFRQDGDLVTVELKDAASRYTNDIIGSTAFGVVCNSVKDRDNEFYKKGKEAATFDLLKIGKYFGYIVAPAVMKFFKITMLGHEATTFFENIIKETLRVRQEKHIVRPDMVHLLMEARKGNLNDDEQNGNGVLDSFEKNASENGKPYKKRVLKITDDDITAQAIIFFVAGFDTTSTAVTYVIYELAIHPEIQERLREEVDFSISESGGNVTYDCVIGMKYLDCVISETLRMHPPIIVTDRYSCKPYTIQPERPGEKPLHLEANSLIWIPISDIQMDPKYFPNPKKFDPERFSEENKHNINQTIYHPFGVGPRACLGYKLAMLEIKMLVVEILRWFEIVAVPKTKNPLKMGVTTLHPLPDDGIWVGFKPR